MNGILLDTCTFAWMLLGRQHLSATAQLAIDGASENLFVSAVTFFESNQKVRLGRWDEMIPYAGDLISLTRLSSSQILQLDGQICAEAGAMAWDHRDPYRPTDRRDGTQKPPTPRISGQTIRRHRRPHLVSGGPTGRRPVTLSGCRAARPSSARRAGT